MIVRCRLNLRRPKRSQRQASSATPRESLFALLFLVVLVVLLVGVFVALLLFHHARLFVATLRFGWRVADIDGFRRTCRCRVRWRCRSLWWRCRRLWGRCRKLWRLCRKLWRLCRRRWLRRRLLRGCNSPALRLDRRTLHGGSSRGRDCGLLRRDSTRGHSLRTGRGNLQRRRDTGHFAFSSRQVARRGWWLRRRDCVRGTLRRRWLGGCGRWLRLCLLLCSGWQLATRQRLLIFAAPDRCCLRRRCHASRADCTRWRHDFNPRRGYRHAWRRRRGSRRGRSRLHRRQCGRFDRLTGVHRQRPFAHCKPDRSGRWLTLRDDATLRHLRRL